MSELMILEKARVRLEDKRRQLAGVLASGDADLGDIANAFTAIQRAIEAMDVAIQDEGRKVDPSASGYVASRR